MALLGGFIVPHPPLIIPQIGKGDERKIQATTDAYHHVAKAIADLRPETIIIITPHGEFYSDYLHLSPGEKGFGHFGRFNQEDVAFSVNYDSELVQDLARASYKQGIPAGSDGENDPYLDHGSMIPLYFINQYYQDYQIVRASVAGLSYQIHYDYGAVMANVISNSDKKIVIIASGDLSHKLTPDGPYGYASEGPDFDNEVIKSIETGNLERLVNLPVSLCEAAAECGLRPLLVLAGALADKKVGSELLSYEGPFGVGYAVAAFNLAAEDEYVSLARMSLEHYITHGEVLPRPTNLSSDLISKKAGVFVSLHRDDQLRGCIGTINPVTGTVADEIIRNSISAGTLDPRFVPVDIDELPYLNYSVDVLGDTEQIDSINELDPQRYGVIVSAAKRRGLLLPNLDGVDTAHDQVRIALQKAGISSEENFSLARFEVVRHQ